MKKKEIAQYLFAANIDVFQCPLCEQDFNEDTLGGLRCLNGHHFDFARNGYLNLLTTRQNTDYGRDLFEARRRVFQEGVYDPIIRKLGNILSGLNKKNPIVLDAGCGEGALLFHLAENLIDPCLIGVDISREGIRFAASYDAPIMWCVADLAKMPVGDHSVDLILNMLSPANYGEFKRILKPGGFLVKIIPGSRYLQELRDRLGDVDEYSNEAVVTVLEENVKVISREHLYYQVPLAQELWPEVVKMTPLTGHREISGKAASQLTVELEIVCGVLG